MKITKLVTSQIIILMFLLVSTSCAESLKNNQPEISIKASTADNILINVQISTISYSSNMLFADAMRWGTTETSKPKTIISSIAIRYGDSDIYMPLSAYSDLANPSKYSIKSGNNKFALIIFGGDAAGSYMAEMTFENGDIKKRHVKHGEFPQERWEETVYSFVIDRGQ